MPIWPILLALGVGAGAWWWTSHKSAAPAPGPAPGPSPAPGPTPPTGMPVGPGPIPAPVPAPGGVPLAVVTPAAPAPAVGHFDLTYPGTGAWQNNHAYIANYQGALKLLSATYNQPSWDPGKVDGTYGPATKSAVMAFQKFAHLPVDGEAGKTTADAMQQALSAAHVGSGITAPVIVGLPAHLAHLAAAQGATAIEYKIDSHARRLHVGQRSCSWKPYRKAPARLQRSFLAAARAMALDPNVPLGMSQHLVNGIMVRVSKPAPAHLYIVSYCAG